MRTIAIGDIHGLDGEFKDLVKRLDLKLSDKLILLGDLVDKGPRSLEVIDHVLELQRKGFNVRAIAGNHEFKAIRNKRSFDMHYKWPKRVMEKEQWIAAAQPRHWDFLFSLPLYIWDKEINYFFVHAGVVPKWLFKNGTPPEVSPDDWNKARGKKGKSFIKMLFVRHVTIDTGRFLALHEFYSGEFESVFWPEFYERTHKPVGKVVYGHSPFFNPAEPHITENTFGIDTGAVFGGKLTALVIDNESGETSFVSVDSEMSYAEPFQPNQRSNL